jgi:hypothetical protein
MFVILKKFFTTYLTLNSNSWLYNRHPIRETTNSRKIKFKDSVTKMLEGLEEQMVKQHNPVINKQLPPRTDVTACEPTSVPAEQHSPHQGPLTSASRTTEAAAERCPVNCHCQKGLEIHNGFLPTL